MGALATFLAAGLAEFCKILTQGKADADKQNEIIIPYRQWQQCSIQLNFKRKMN